MSGVVDLRSDTVTRPTATMAAVEVGDDVFGDDPTVNALQETIAAPAAAARARPRRLTQLDVDPAGVDRAVAAMGEYLH